MTFIGEIEAWIEELNAHYRGDRRSCAEFENAFQEFYSREFLDSAGFVIVDQLPLPDTPQVRTSGILDQLESRKLGGITYDDTYYMLRSEENTMRLHFHELVHVAQWRILGRQRFITDYAEELVRYGYSREAPLEGMAQKAEAHYVFGKEPYDVVQSVRCSLAG